jgi:arsenate reductase
MTSLTARAATVADAEAIARIYSEGIEDRVATFETRPRTAADVAQWFDGRHPIVVVESAGKVIAFAASFEWRAHERYRGIAEIAVYVARAARGMGAGRLALSELSMAAQRLGFAKLLGALFVGNAGSRALMRAAGFREVGVYERQAQLEGQWKDVLLVEKVFPLPKKVIFACVHNAGRSQMAAAFFNQLAEPGRARAISAGTQPAAQVHPEVLATMKELGIELSDNKPQRLTFELARDASLLVTMGCGEECPVVPGAQREDWPLPDPKGKPLEEVRRIRDELRARVAALIERERWA